MEISAADSEQLISFRSSRRWSKASKILRASDGRPMPILFGVVDRGPVALYGARLQEVILEPSPSDQRAQELLQLRPPTTMMEDWWGNVRTIYAISGLRELNTPISYSSLCKHVDGTPLSNEFKYSYAIVTIAEPSFVPPVQVASDVASAPSRIDAVVSRVVRDTALTRRLKAMHDDRCQLCGVRLEFPTGAAYSEAHHLKPLGRPHNGPDVEENIVVLCPNCHALCDHGAIKVARSSIRIVDGHEIDEEFMEYHNRKISEGMAG